MENVVQFDKESAEWHLQNEINNLEKREVSYQLDIKSLLTTLESVRSNSTSCQEKIKTFRAALEKLSGDKSVFQGKDIYK